MSSGRCRFHGRSVVKMAMCGTAVGAMGNAVMAPMTGSVAMLSALRFPVAYHPVGAGGGARLHTVVGDAA